MQHIILFPVCIAFQRPNSNNFAYPAAFVELNGRTLMRAQDSGIYHSKFTVNTIDAELCDESEKFIETSRVSANSLKVAEYISDLPDGTIVLGNLFELFNILVVSSLYKLAFKRLIDRYVRSYGNVSKSYE